MAHSGRFVAQEHQAEAEWQGPTWSRLARVCDAARLTNREARILNLFLRGLSLREIGEILGVRRYQVIVWRSLHASIGKVALGRTSSPSERRAWAWAILGCVRNVRSTNPQAPAQYVDAYDQVREVPRSASIVTPEDLAPDLEQDACGLLEWLEQNLRELAEKPESATEVAA